MPENLCESLKNIRDSNDRARTNITIGWIYEYDIDTKPKLLDDYCAKCDLVFNLAGVNHSQNPDEFMQGNFGFANTLLDTLKNIITLARFCSHLRYKQPALNVITAIMAEVKNDRGADFGIWRSNRCKGFRLPFF